MSRTGGTMGRQGWGVAVVALLLGGMGCAFWAGPKMRVAERCYPLTPDAAPLVRALEALRLTPETLRFSPPHFNAIGADRFRTRVFDVYATQPLAIPYILSHVSRAALEKPRSVHETTMGMVAKVDMRVFRGMQGYNSVDEVVRAVEKSDVPLSDAIETVLKVSGQEAGFSDRERARCEAAERALPMDLRRAAAVVLRGAASAAGWHARAFEFAPQLLSGDLGKEFVAYLTQPDAELPTGVERAMDAVDFGALYAGGEDLTMAVDKGRDMLMDRKTTETLGFVWNTPMGRIVLRAGSGDFGAVSEWTEPVLLLIDLDGDDVYRGQAGANVPGKSPVSVLMDFGGNDRYEAAAQVAEGAFGAGVLGYGVLVDTAGDDTYCGGMLTQGCGVVGMGALLDMQGNDSYEATGLAQGAGAFGLGLLDDLSGNDSYRSFTMSQAFGFTRGCGQLLDLGGGADHYVLRNDEVRYPSAQAPKTHNSSLGQGCGLGRRADLTDGRSWAGGYGLLIDDGGHDTYEAAVFAQGTGYWYGLGFLLDVAGNDRYRAHWYAQGGPAHFGVGALIDYAGDDHYVCTANVAQGGSHDWSVSWLLDAAGDDEYEAGELCLGTANANGIGIFLDIAGNDRYRAIRKTVNNAVGGARYTDPGSMREAFINAGLFLDCGGDDVYTSFTQAGNNRLWLEKQAYPDAGLPVNLGVGVDTEAAGRSPVRYQPYTEKKK